MTRVSASKLVWAVACALAASCGPSRETESLSAVVADQTDGASSQRTSDDGKYRVSLLPVDGQIPLGKLHAWILHVETLAGEPFAPARLAVSGGMPQHNHGFTTEPRVTRSLGGGDFLIEGVKFHMSGQWVLRFEIVGGGESDTATFEIQVGP